MIYTDKRIAHASLFCNSESLIINSTEAPGWPREATRGPRIDERESKGVSIDQTIKTKTAHRRAREN